MSARTWAPPTYFVNVGATLGSTLAAVINVPAVILSGSGVLIMAIAYRNRDQPAWQRDMRAIIILAIGQVLLGTAMAATALLAR